MNQTSAELCELGWKYQYGIDASKDEKKAFEYYQKAADLGDGEGLFWTGFFYNWGIGAEKDEQKAFEHYLKSAEAGNSMGIGKQPFVTITESVRQLFTSSDDDMFTSSVEMYTSKLINITGSKNRDLTIDNIKI